MSERCWDGENCPHESCDGDLQQQDWFNVMCLDRRESWSHTRTETAHRLTTAEGEIVAAKPAVATDGGTSVTQKHPPGFPPCPGCGEAGFSVQKWIVLDDGGEVQMWQCNDSECRVEEYRPRDCDPQDESGSIGL